jgi:hypothetical protein
MGFRPKTFSGWFLIAAFGAWILTSGCFSRWSVDRSFPPLLNLKENQPAALLPVADFPESAGSGSNLLQATREILEKKGFALISQEKVSQALAELNQTPQGLLADPTRLPPFSDATGSKLVVVGVLLDYRTQKSYLSSGTSQVWEGAFYEYRTLPTYHQGACQMKVRLQILEAQTGRVVWMAEGKGAGPSSSREKILRALVEDLMKEVPPLREKR